MNVCDIRFIPFQIPCEYIPSHKWLSYTLYNIFNNIMMALIYDRDYNHKH